LVVGNREAQHDHPVRPLIEAQQQIGGAPWQSTHRAVISAVITS